MNEIYVVTYDIDCSGVKLEGYFTNKKEAEKYCASRKIDDCVTEEYRVKPLTCYDDIEDLSNVKLKYEHSFVFVYDKLNDNWIMTDGETAYDFYCEEYRSNSITINSLTGNYRWIKIYVNSATDNRKELEVVAQNIFNQYLAECDNKPSEKTANQFNKILAHEEIERERLKKEEELRQKELKELQRLKEKYEKI